MKNTINKWISLVSIQDADEVVNLYADNGLLLGTFSDKIRIGKNKIREYFEYFLAQNPKAKIINIETHTNESDMKVFSGFYDFEVDDDNQARKIVSARFTFVFQLINNEFKIISHHSSIIP